MKTAILRLFAAFGAALALTAAVIALAHGSPSAALSALASGSFGSWYEVGNTINKTTPLLLTGLGIAIAFRARLWNIGGEGQFLMGALAASALGAYGLKSLPAVVLIPLLCCGGMLAGAAWAGLAGWMRVARGVPEVISTIMLNFIAAQILSYLLHGPLQERSHAQPASEALPPAASLPIILPQTSAHAGIIIALAAAAATAVFLYQTRAGFALRAVGANPEAARVAGISVARTQMQAMLFSGALCGLAGAVELSGLIGTLYENYAPGYGFKAIAVALLGQLNPFGIIASAALFGALDAGAGEMERSAGISSVLVYVIQAVVLLVLLAVRSARFARPVKAEAFVP